MNNFFSQEVEAENNLLAVTEYEIEDEDGVLDVHDSSSDECDYQMSDESDSISGDANDSVNEARLKVKKKYRKNIKRAFKGRKPIVDQKLKCDQCERTFKRHTDLKHHMKLHSAGIIRVRLNQIITF